MIVVTAFAQVRPEAVEDARTALLRAQEATLTEDGCLAYRYFGALDDPTSFVAVENWRDEAALRAHLRSPHIAELSGVLETVVTGPLDIQVYDATAVDLG